ncbi:MAG TPA: O-antigen ligase family protein [Xanthomonadaceae bacterium]|jgi:O-antigen ligase
MFSSLLLALTHAQDFMGLLAPAALLMFLIAQFRLLRVPRTFDLTTMAFIVLTVWLVVSTVFNGTWVGIPISNYVSQYCQMFYMVGFYLIMRFIKFNDRLEKYVFGSVIFAGCLYSLLSLFSLYIHPLTIWGVKFSGQGFVFGPFGAHDPMAAMTGVALVLAWVLFNERASRPFQKFIPIWLLLPAMGILAMTFLLARSRGYAVGLIIALFLPILWRTLVDFKSRKMSRQVLLGLVSAGFICIAMGFVLSDRIASIFQTGAAGAVSDDPNVETRFLLWLRALGLISQSAVTGIGPGAFEQVGLQMTSEVPYLVSQRRAGTYSTTKIEFDPEGGLHAHDVFLEIWVEWGLIGFVLIFTAFLSAMYAARKAIRRYDDQLPDEGRRRFMLSLAATLFLFLCGSGLTGGYTLMSPTTCWLFYFVLARMRVGLAHDRRLLALPKPEART